MEACEVPRWRSPVYCFAALTITIAFVALWTGRIDSVTTVLYPVVWLASMIHIAGVGVIVWRQPERANTSMVRSLLTGTATLLVSLGLMRESPQLAGYFVIALTVPTLGVCALVIALHIAANRPR